MSKEPGSAYDKWNISVVICDINSVTVKHNQVMVWFGFMVLNANNISVISAMSWLSVLLVEETAVPEAP
jgi:hypothetical protein